MIYCRPGFNEPLKKHLNQIQPMQAGQMDLDDGVNGRNLDWFLGLLAEKQNNNNGIYVEIKKLGI